MSRRGPKRKIKPREPSGRICKAARDPRPSHDYEPASPHTRNLRAYLTGDPNSRCDWHDPIEHFHFRGMTKTMRAAAMRYRRDGRLMLALDEAPDFAKDTVLGRLQPLGAVASVLDIPWDDNDAHEAWKQATEALKTLPQRNTVYRLCVLMQPQFTHATDIEGAETYWRLLLKPWSAPFLSGLEKLVTHYGYDREAKPDFWRAEQELA